MNCVVLFPNNLIFYFNFFFIFIINLKINKNKKFKFQDETHYAQKIDAFEN